MDIDVLRILDANLNRAREALRVIEDHARFALDDQDAAAAAKDLRHDLVQSATELPAERLLMARNTAGDVGRTLKTAAELRRGDAVDVVRAGFARLTEALRVISEYGKVAAPALAAAAERLRYRAYELETCALLRAEPRAGFRRVRLYVIITAALCRADWLVTAEAALRGGAACLQLREKSLGDGELLRRARDLRGLTSRYGALLVINDRPDIARLAAADGVHVGQDDLPVAEARRIAGSRLLVGKSTHTEEQVRAAVEEQPDYIAVGPMFPSPTKPQAHVPGPGLLARAAELTELPLVAIGGITPENAREVVAAGALCACSAVIGADGPESAARSLLSIAR